MDAYETISVLGEGTYGVVIKARQRATGRLVAIKKFKQSEDDDEHVRKTSLREMRVLKQLRHPNIVGLLDVFRRDGRLYLVFEYVDHTILQLLERSNRGLTPSELRQYMYQLLRSLDFCHAHNIIHRDVKPENILIARNGLLKLCDFGFARHMSSKGKYTDYVATRWYRAPELLVGDVGYGKAVDVWAVGCIFAELSDTRPLFPGDSDLSQLGLILRTCGAVPAYMVHLFEHNPLYRRVTFPQPTVHRTLQQRYPAQPPEWMEFLTSCLRTDPHDRLSCAELMNLPYFTHDGFRATYEAELCELAGPPPPLRTCSLSSRSLLPATTTTAATKPASSSLRLQQQQQQQQRSSSKSRSGLTSLASGNNGSRKKSSSRRSSSRRRSGRARVPSTRHNTPAAAAATTLSPSAASTTSLCPGANTSSTLTTTTMTATTAAIAAAAASMTAAAKALVGTRRTRTRTSIGGGGSSSSRSRSRRSSTSHMSATQQSPYATGGDSGKGRRSRRGSNCSNSSQTSNGSRRGGGGSRGASNTSRNNSTSKHKSHEHTQQQQQQQQRRRSTSIGCTSEHASEHYYNKPTAPHVAKDSHGRSAHDGDASTALCLPTITAGAHDVVGGNDMSSSGKQATATAMTTTAAGTAAAGGGAVVASQPLHSVDHASNNNNEATALLRHAGAAFPHLRGTWTQQLLLDVDENEYAKYATTTAAAAAGNTSNGRHANAGAQAAGSNAHAGAQHEALALRVSTSLASDSFLPSISSVTTTTTTTPAPPPSTTTAAVATSSSSSLWPPPPLLPTTVTTTAATTAAAAHGGKPQMGVGYAHAHSRSSLHHLPSKSTAAASDAFVGNGSSSGSSTSNRKSNNVEVTIARGGGNEDDDSGGGSSSKHDGGGGSTQSCLSPLQYRQDTQQHSIDAATGSEYGGVGVTASKSSLFVSGSSSSLLASGSRGGDSGDSNNDVTTALTTMSPQRRASTIQWCDARSAQTTAAAAAEAGSDGTTQSTHTTATMGDVAAMCSSVCTYNEPHNVPDDADVVLLLPPHSTSATAATNDKALTTTTTATATTATTQSMPQLKISASVTSNGHQQHNGGNSSNNNKQHAQQLSARSVSSTRNAAAMNVASSKRHATLSYRYSQSQQQVPPQQQQQPPGHAAAALRALGVLREHAYLHKYAQYASSTAAGHDKPTATPASLGTSDALAKTMHGTVTVPTTTQSTSDVADKGDGSSNSSTRHAEQQQQPTLLLHSSNGVGVDTSTSRSSSVSNNTNNGTTADTLLPLAMPARRSTRSRASLSYAGGANSNNTSSSSNNNYSNNSSNNNNTHGTSMLSSTLWQRTSGATRARRPLAKSGDTARDEHSDGNAGAQHLVTPQTTRVNGAGEQPLHDGYTQHGGVPTAQTSTRTVRGDTRDGVAGPLQASLRYMALVQGGDAYARALSKRNATPATLSRTSGAGNATVQQQHTPPLVLAQAQQQQQQQQQVARLMQEEQRRVSNTRARLAAMHEMRPTASTRGGGGLGNTATGTLRDAAHLALAERTARYMRARYMPPP